MRKCAILSLLVVLLGCGSGQNQPFSTFAPAPPTEAEIIQQATVADADKALKLVPSEHLDPLPLPVAPRGTPMTISVQDLETAYEILFCHLSKKLGVTKITPQVVDDIAFIKSQPETGNFDLNARPISNNPLGVTGVAFQPVSYQTTVPLPAGPQTFQVSGGLLMPQGISASQVRGVIVYFHGTTFNKEQVGSEYLDNTETQLTAQVWGSQGYIVLIPDYVGQGDDWQNVHPYVLYPRVSAQTAVDMLAAVQPTIVDEYSFASDAPPLKLFSAGYSEGGAYSLWLNIYLSENPGLLDPFYQLTHSVGMEGAYNTSSITYGYLFEDVDAGGSNPYNVQSQTLVNMVKPILSADAFLSYATYSVGSDFLSIFNSDFFAMQATFPVLQELCNVNGQQVNIAQAFALPDTTIAAEVLSSGLGKSGNGGSYPGPIEVAFTSKNSIDPLVSSDLLTPESQAELQQVLVAADVELTAVADQGVSIITLAQDSVVVSNNFDFLLASYPSKIKNAIKIDQSQIQVLSIFSEKLGYAYFVPVDHLGGPIYEFLYALNIFNSF